MRNRRRNFLDTDSFVIGLAIGAVGPVVAYGILLTLYDFLEAQLIVSDVGFAPGFRTRTLMLISICTTLIPFHIYYRWRADNTMRGMVLPTVIYVCAWFYIYGRHLIGL